MPKTSFTQSSFRGGVWSALVQGRFDDPKYKEGLNTSLNALSIEQGPWTRRPGTRYVAHTKAGLVAKLVDFDFKVSQPYQIEFTNLFARFFQGLSHVYMRSSATDVQDPPIWEIGKDIVTGDAIVYLFYNLPTGWASGNTVVIDFKRVPCSAPALCGRQLLLSDLNATDKAFKIKDALTGAYISFAQTGWQDYSVDEAPIDATVGLDIVRKIHEIATPYPTADVGALRTVQDVNNVLIFHQKYKPRKISAVTTAVPATFQIATEDFLDGPYLEVNKTATTFALGGTSGSVSVTASTIVGINDGAGFQTTDIGRVIRFASGPSQWSNAVTYATGARITATDGNIYTAVKGGNLNRDPTVDDGTWWEVSSDTTRWTWLRITARSSTTVVTATILGVNASTTTATTNWRLGLYSDTTGWPKDGVYHEGRLWLIGKESNRIDGSKSGEPFNFEPTAPDGTVADNNGISATADAEENNAFFWLHSTGDGLIIGAQGGEWRIRASSLDDPLSPFTVQMRKVSQYGCHDTTPVEAGKLVFVQRQKRKLMAHLQTTAADYLAENLAEKAIDLTVNGIEEIVWQQEPFLTIWARRTDGKLVSCFYRIAPPNSLTADDTIWSEDGVGWHEHELGSGRTVVSLSTGPAPDGLSDTLFMVTNDVATGVHFIEMMRPSFDAQQQGWAGAFVDAGANICCVEVKKINRGDSFDGVRMWGFHHLNGKTVVPVIASLDLGNRVAANGYVDVPFLSDPEGVFTEAFLTTEVNNEYGGLEGTLVNWYNAYTPVSPPVNSYAMVAYVGTDADGVNGSYDGTVMYEWRDTLNLPRTYQLQDLSGGITAGIRVLNSTTGTEITRKSEADLLIAFPGRSLQGGLPCTFMQDGDVDKKYIVAPIDGSNSTQWAQIEVSDTVIAVGSIYGVTGADVVPDGTQDAVTGAYWLNNTKVQIPGRSVAPLRFGISTLFQDDPGRPFVNGFVYGGLSSAGGYRNIFVMSARESSMFLININGNSITDNNVTDVCTGLYGSMPIGTYFAMGHPAYGAAATTGWTLFKGAVAVLSGAVWISAQRQITTARFITPVLIDATWTNFSDFVGIMFDQHDRDVLFWAVTTDAVTNQYYLVKWDVDNQVIKWKIALPFNPAATKDEQHCAVQEINGEFCVLNTGLSPGVDILYRFNTITGTMTTIAVNPGHLVGANQLWDPKTASITGYGNYNDGGTPDPTLLGTWLAGNPLPFSLKWHRIYFANFTYPEYNTALSASDYYTIPTTGGFTYTSKGQILPPNFGQDAGNAAGPGFAKKRRNHWYGLGLYRTRGMSVGATFAKMYPVKIETVGGTPIAAPTLQTATVTTTIQDDYSFDGMIAWQVTRPYNVTLTVVSGFIDGHDK